VLYRIVIQLALMAGLDPNDMKLISAVLVVVALILPQWKVFRRVPTLNEMKKSLAGAKG
jgi:putative tryptophan/tyrosine transport system permease protein